MTIVYGIRRPKEEVLDWFIKHIGPLRHWSKRCVIGHGWRLDANRKEWSLTVDDEKMLTYWTLVR